MHIFSLCALGSSYCFHPQSNLSIEERTKKVNTCHSASASFSSDGCREVSRSVCLLVASLFVPPLAASLWECAHWWFCNSAVFESASVPLWIWPLQPELQSFTWCTVTACLRKLKTIRETSISVATCAKEVLITKRGSRPHMGEASPFNQFRWSYFSCSSTDMVRSQCHGGIPLSWYCGGMVTCKVHTAVDTSPQLWFLLALILSGLLLSITQ